MIDRSDINIIRNLILEETKWFRHYTGKVADNVDPANKGRVKVIIYELSLDQFNASAAKGFWCYPRDKHSMSIPAIGEWVEVYFWNADENKPIYMGAANEIAEMLPDNFDNLPTTHVLFEDPDNKIHAVFDALQNVLSIGNQSFQKAARLNDVTLSNSATDSAFWTFISTLITYLTSHTHTGVTVGSGVSGAPSSPPPSAPSTLTGKINSGSGQVQIGDA